MMLILCLTIGVILNIVATENPYYDIGAAGDLFENFIKTYDRSYSNEAEKQKRFEIFRDNLITINHMNSISGAVFGVNKFSDLTIEEFTTLYMGLGPSSLNVSTNCTVVTDEDITTKDAPASINWVELGKVTAVKNQEKCGSCWAFSTIGNIESQYAIKTQQLISLSEQELVDCSKNNNGCGGGYPHIALNDLIGIGGVESESSYSYTAKDQKCQFNKAKVEVKIKSCINYRITDEEKFKEVIAKKGPVSVGVFGSNLPIYKHGILTKAQCPAQRLNHAVLVVGYGSENGTDYWLIKNSWGTKFGEKGYFRITRGENTCGLMGDKNASAEV